jgi:hypothetical protein
MFLLFIIPFVILIGIKSEKNKPKNDEFRPYIIGEHCIEGHIYYFHGGIAPKLDDNGRPIHCDSSYNKYFKIEILEYK